MCLHKEYCVCVPLCEGRWDSTLKLKPVPYRTMAFALQRSDNVGADGCTGIVEQPSPQGEECRGTCLGNNKYSNIANYE